MVAELIYKEELADGDTKKLGIVLHVPKDVYPVILSVLMRSDFEITTNQFNKITIFGKLK